MKKIMILLAISLLVSTSAFAAGALSVSVSTGFPTAGQQLLGGSTDATNKIGKTSTGVEVGMLVVSTGTGYSLVTQHKSGTKAFGSSYDSTAIYATIADGNPGTVILAVPTATDTTNFAGTTWKPM